MNRICETCLGVKGKYSDATNLIPPKAGHFPVPLANHPLSVCWCWPHTLLHDEEVLPHTEPVHLPALRTVVSKLALVCMPLRYHSKFWVPRLRILLCSTVTNMQIPPSVSCWLPVVVAQAVPASPYQQQSQPGTCILYLVMLTIDILALTCCGCLQSLPFLPL